MAPLGWTDALAQLLVPAVTDRFMHDLHSNPRHTRYPAGIIWKAELARSLFADLSLGIYGVRRFVRLEYPGLSGIILYNLPAGRHPSESISKYDDNDEDLILTMEAVFGDADDEGMGVETMIDAIDGRLVYFPAYACTSFVVSHFSNRSIPHGMLTISSTDRSSHECRRAFTPSQTETKPTWLRRRFHVVQVVQTLQIHGAPSVLSDCTRYQHVPLFQALPAGAEDGSSFVAQIWVEGFSWHPC
jgi:hypothetical protein